MFSAPPNACWTKIKLKELCAQGQSAWSRGQRVCRREKIYLSKTSGPNGRVERSIYINADPGFKSGRFN